jgi:hypothetical protein
MKIIQSGLSILLLFSTVSKADFFKTIIPARIATLLLSPLSLTNKIIEKSFIPSLQPEDKRFMNRNLFDWYIADQTAHIHVYQITNDPSVMVIATEDKIASSTQVRNTGTKCICLNPGLIRALKRRNTPISWQYYKDNSHLALAYSLSYDEAKSIILHEYAHIKNNDTKRTRLLRSETALSAEEIREQLIKMEFDADSAVINSSDMETIVGFESFMMKQHHDVQQYSMVDEEHPEPLARARRATEEINKRLGIWA